MAIRLGYHCQFVWVAEAFIGASLERMATIDKQAIELANLIAIHCKTLWHFVIQLPWIATRSNCDPLQFLSIAICSNEVIVATRGIGKRMHCLPSRGTNTAAHKNRAIVQAWVMRHFRVGVDAWVRVRFESWRVGCPCHVLFHPEPSWNLKPSLVHTHVTCYHLVAWMTIMPFPWVVTMYTGHCYNLGPLFLVQICNHGNAI